MSEAKKTLKAKLNFVTKEARNKAITQLKSSLGWRLLKMMIEEGELDMCQTQLQVLELDHKDQDYQTIDEYRLGKYKIKELQYRIECLQGLLGMPDMLLQEYDQDDIQNDDPYKTAKEMGNPLA